MRTKRTAVSAIILFVFCLVSTLPNTANAQETSTQNPLLIVKISDVEKLLGHIQNLALQAPGLNAAQQMNNIRMMLNGTDWIDTGRSITIGVVMDNGKTNGVALIPFFAPNDTFQNMYDATAGADYYIVPIPPGQPFAVSSVLEQKLNESSRIPTDGSLVAEAAAGRILSMVEPGVLVALQSVEAAQSAENAPSPLSTQDMSSIITEMFTILRQAEILRFGIDLSENAFTLLMDVDAVPGSDLAATLVDVGGTARLLDYPIDMPLKYNARAYNVSGSQKLMQSYMKTVYSILGLDINIDDMVEMSTKLTGEVAGGMNITPEGLEMKIAAVMQPGIDGEAFLRDSYLPLLENYSRTISEMADEQGGTSQLMNVERTADSIVEGAQVMGVRAIIQSLDPKQQSGLDNMNIEMRMASVNDYLFIASRDSEIEELIRGTKNLPLRPATGPTGRMVLDMSALMQSLKTVMPAGQAPSELPEDLGKISIEFDLKDGRIATRTSLDIDMIQRLVSSIAAAATAGNTPDNAASPETL